MTDPLILSIAVIALGSVLLISLSRDLQRAFRWFMRTLGRVMIALALVGLGYALLVTKL